MKRYFSFGCSFTYHSWATYADIIGANFDQHHNFGEPGCSNRRICDKLVEVDTYFKFNSETDFVTVMLTGINRFSWFTEEELSWLCTGDLEGWKEANYKNINPDPARMTGFIDRMWNDRWAIYETYISLLTMKSILNSKKIKHKILLGLDIDHYKTFNLGNDWVIFLENIENLLDVKRSLHDINGNSPGIVFENGQVDGHPSIDTHLKYVEYALPEYYTDKAREFAQEYNRQFDTTSRDAQATKWNKKANSYNRFQGPWQDLLR